MTLGDMQTIHATVMELHTLFFIRNPVLRFEPLMLRNCDVIKKEISRFEGLVSYKGFLIKEKGVVLLSGCILGFMPKLCAMHALTQDSWTLKYLEIKKDIPAINHYLRPPCLTV